MDTMGHTTERKVRQHPAQLRALVLAECAVPGASVAKVAREHGLNANLIHTWRRQQRQQHGQSAAQPATEEFIALPLAQQPARASCGDIRIELRRGATTVNVSWPGEAAGECAAWLGAWLR